MFASEIDLRISTLTRLAAHAHDVQLAASRILLSLKNNHKVFWIGNGGSAGDAQHLSAELVGRFTKDRKALASIALTTDTSAITCISNDFSYDHVFVRQIEALARQDDTLVALTTSGASQNILNALDTARELGMSTILLTSERYTKRRPYDITISVPSTTTEIIQECHMTIGHTICKMIDEAYND